MVFLSKYSKENFENSLQPAAPKDLFKFNRLFGIIMKFSDTGLNTPDRSSTALLQKNFQVFWHLIQIVIIFQVRCLLLRHFVWKILRFSENIGGFKIFRLCQKIFQSSKCSW